MAFGSDCYLETLGWQSFPCKLMSTIFYGSPFKFIGFGFHVSSAHTHRLLVLSRFYHGLPKPYLHMMPGTTYQKGQEIVFWALLILVVWGAARLKQRLSKLAGTLGFRPEKGLWPMAFRQRQVISEQMPGAPISMKSRRTLAKHPSKTRVSYDKGRNTQNMGLWGPSSKLYVMLAR